MPRKFGRLRSTTSLTQRPIGPIWSHQVFGPFVDSGLEERLLAQSATFKGQVSRKYFDFLFNSLHDFMRHCSPYPIRPYAFKSDSFRAITVLVARHADHFEHLLLPFLARRISNQYILQRFKFRLYLWMLKDPALWQPHMSQMISTLASVILSSRDFSLLGFSNLAAQAQQW